MEKPFGPSFIFVQINSFWPTTLGGNILTCGTVCSVTPGMAQNLNGVPWSCQTRWLSLNISGGDGGSSNIALFGTTSAIKKG